ncbi:MAG TPA: c-type cytochrome [Candidatus Sulfotelmatobacter sp.]
MNNEIYAARGLAKASSRACIFFRQHSPLTAVIFLLLIFPFTSAVAQTPGSDTERGKTKSLATSEPPPAWAYVIKPETDTSDISSDINPSHVPNSEAAFTFSQTKDLFNPPDWHPSDHPAMPEIVAHGRKPDVFACGYCHLPTGQGRPENSSLAGLQARYIIQQLSDFKHGLRKSSELRHKPTSTMISAETQASDVEIETAAKYFSQLKPAPWIRVVETTTVAKTHIYGWMLVKLDTNDTEPLGRRIIETPEDPKLAELRDSRSGFIAYVPPGSIKAGKVLVNSGGATKTSQCTTCHGPELRGLGDAPQLAGRSPSYTVRQLYDMQSGARDGLAMQKMKPAVMKLSMDDMIAIAAYVASLKP